MAMASAKRVMLGVALAAASSAAMCCEVQLANATRADVMLQGLPKSLVLAPGESDVVRLEALSAVGVGAEEVEFKFGRARAFLCSGKRKELELRLDGRLWLKGARQPKGMPLAPARMHDLTGLPSNA